jgi:hypothetical protein
MPTSDIAEILVKQCGFMGRGIEMMFAAARGKSKEPT